MYIQFILNLLYTDEYEKHSIYVLNIGYRNWHRKLDVMTTSHFANRYIKLPYSGTVVFMPCNHNKCKVSPSPSTELS